MRKRTIAVCFLTALSAAVLPTRMAAQTPAIPNLRGVYVRGADGFVGLPSNMLLPFGDSSVRWLFGFGRGAGIAEIPGPHSTIQTTRTKPELYVRGFPASSGIYLVRETEGQDYRELRMPITSDIRQWSRFRKQDVLDIDIKPVLEDVLEVTPRADLKPGEYLLVSTLDPIYNNIKIAFDFGVSTAK